MFALASIPLWRRFARRVEKPVDQPFLNRRADAFVGREFTLEKPIVDGNGTVRIDDTIWRVHRARLPGGSRVKVVRATPRLLVVERGVALDPQTWKWIESGIGALRHAARSRSCKCTMPTGVPASTTNTRGDLR